MSFKYTALALDHGPSDPLQKLLFMSLTDRCDEKGVCFPSRDDLLRRTGVSYATISRKLRLLEVQGWIQRRRRFNCSTVFRINIERLLRLDAEATQNRITTVPKGFEPFEDEVSQPIENKGTVHSDPTSVHSEPTSVHSEPLTYQKPTKKPYGSRRISNLDIKTLSNFQRSKILSAQPCLVSGALLAPSSPEAEAIRKALRAAFDTEKGGVA